MTLSGTVTIGGAAPTYATINAFQTALQTNGVSGPLIVNIRDGTYNETLTLTSITGVSSVNTITIQSETMSRSNVIIDVNSLANDVVGIIDLTDTQFVTFQSLSIQYSGPVGTVRNCVSLKGIINCTFDDCDILCVGSDPISINCFRIFNITNFINFTLNDSALIGDNGLNIIPISGGYFSPTATNVMTVTNNFFECLYCINLKETAFSFDVNNNTINHHTRGFEFFYSEANISALSVSTIPYIFNVNGNVFNAMSNLDNYNNMRTSDVTYIVFDFIQWVSNPSLSEVSCTFNANENFITTLGIMVPNPSVTPGVTVLFDPILANANNPWYFNIISCRGANLTNIDNNRIDILNIEVAVNTGWANSFRPIYIHSNFRNMPVVNVTRNIIEFFSSRCNIAFNCIEIELNVTTTNTTRHLVENNVIFNSGGDITPVAFPDTPATPYRTFILGFRTTNPRNMDFFHNTIKMTNTGSPADIRFLHYSYSNINPSNTNRINNNLFYVNIAQGSVVSYYTYPESTDYNLFHMDTLPTPPLSKYQIQTGINPPQTSNSISILGSTSNCLEVDPMFLPNDYHIAQTSPAIAAGRSDVAITTTLDIDGEMRGPTFDMGADQFGSSGPTQILTIPFPPALPTPPITITPGGGNTWVVNDNVTNLPGLSTGGGQFAHVTTIADGVIPVYDSSSNSVTTLEFNDTYDLSMWNFINVTFEALCVGVKGKDYGTVEFSLNNGTNWFEVFIIDTVSVWTSYTIPFQVNGTSQFKMRVKFYTDNSGVTNPPFCIDSFVVDGVSGLPTIPLPYTNNFNIPGPVGWVSPGTDMGASIWVVNQDYAPGAVYGTGPSNYLHITDASKLPGDRGLYYTNSSMAITQLNGVFDCTSVPTLDVRFDWIGLMETTNDYCSFDISINGGTSWTSLIIPSMGVNRLFGSSIWKNEILNVNTSNSNQVRFRFKFTSNASMINTPSIGIENIQIAQLMSTPPINITPVIDICKNILTINGVWNPPGVKSNPDLSFGVGNWYISELQVEIMTTGSFIVNSNVNTGVSQIQPTISSNQFINTGRTISSSYSGGILTLKLNQSGSTASTSQFVDGSNFLLVLDTTVFGQGYLNLSGTNTLKSIKLSYKSMNPVITNSVFDFFDMIGQTVTTTPSAGSITLAQVNSTGTSLTINGTWGGSLLQTPFLSGNFSVLSVRVNVNGSPLTSGTNGVPGSTISLNGTDVTIAGNQTSRDGSTQYTITQDSMFTPRLGVAITALNQPFSIVLNNLGMADIVGRGLTGITIVYGDDTTTFETVFDMCYNSTSFPFTITQNTFSPNGKYPRISTKTNMLINQLITSYHP